MRSKVKGARFKDAFLTFTFESFTLNLFLESFTYTHDHTP